MAATMPIPPPTPAKPVQPERDLMWMRADTFSGSTPTTTILRMEGSIARDGNGFPVPPPTPAQPVSTTSGSGGSATTTSLPVPGDPDFWQLLPEVIIVNLLDTINWATVIPALIAILVHFLGAGVSTPMLVDFLGAMGGINVVGQGAKAFAGRDNLTRARAAARAKMAAKQETVLLH